MKPQPELNDCPGCGSPAQTRKDNDYNSELRYYVTCTRCSFQTKKPTKHEAVADWNRRK